MHAAFSLSSLPRPTVSALVVVALAVSSRALAAPSEGCSSVNVLAGKEPIEVVNVTGDTAHVTDGLVAAEGAAWDAPPAITSRGIGGVTFDLGELKPLSVAYLQGDANDTYLLTGSVEGKPGTFHVLGEFAKVGERGAGLRGRTLRFPPENLRFLRIRSGHGDDEFAIAELAAYCAEPTPFPPAFRVDEMTNAAPSPGPASTSEQPDATRQKLVIAAAVVVGLAFWILRSRLRAKLAASGRNAKG